MVGFASSERGPWLSIHRLRKLITSDCNAKAKHCFFHALLAIAFKFCQMHLQYVLGYDVSRILVPINHQRTTLAPASKILDGARLL